MDIIKKFGLQLANIWKSWSRIQQAGIAIVACLCVLSIVGLGYWASSKEFVTLVNQLSPTDAHEVISALESDGIDYRLNYSGSAVSVSTTDVSRARLSIKSIGLESKVEEETGAGIWSDPTQQLAQQQRNLERRLAASIQQIHSIRAATVHITRPDPSPFLRNQQAPKASVVLQLDQSAHFSSVDARAIASLVSHAVENLDPENTTIVDTDGHILSENSQVGGDVSGQLEYRRRLETDLASKAEAMLSPLLGHGRAVVRVSADIDFTETKTDRKSYDPDTKVKVKETISTETMTGKTARASGGAPGTASNVGDLSLNKDGMSTETETIDTEYLNTEIVDSIREAPGTIKRLTIAAVVELPEPVVAEGTEQAAVPQITTEQIQRIIKQAVGFDTLRNDEIEVVAGKLASHETLAAPTGWVSIWNEIKPLMGAISLGLASLVALILGLAISRKLKPMVVEVNQRDRMDPEMRARLADLSEEIKQHPDAVSTVFSAWLAGHSQTQDGQKTKAA